MEYIAVIGVALITGSCSVLGQYFIARTQSDKYQAVTDIRLDTIEVKLDKHNNFMERLAILETSKTDIAGDIAEIKNNCIKHKDLNGGK